MVVVAVSEPFRQVPIEEFGFVPFFLHSITCKKNKPKTNRWWMLDARINNKNDNWKGIYAAENKNSNTGLVSLSLDPNKTRKKQDSRSKMMMYCRYDSYDFNDRSTFSVRSFWSQSTRKERVIGTKNEKSALRTAVKSNYHHNLYIRILPSITAKNLQRW